MNDDSEKVDYFEGPPLSARDMGIEESNLGSGTPQVHTDKDQAINNLAAIKARLGNAQPFDAQQIAPPETDPLLENHEALVGIANASAVVREYIQAQKPDAIIISGTSRKVTRTILEAMNVVADPTIVEFDGELNSLMYKEGINIPEDDGERNQFIQEQLAKFPQLTEKSGKVMVLDEFIETGGKARGFTDRLHQLGYADVTYSAIVANKDPKSLVGDSIGNTIVVGATDDTLVGYLKAVTKRLSSDPAFETTFSAINNKASEPLLNTLRQYVSNAQPRHVNTMNSTTHKKNTK